MCEHVQYTQKPILCTNIACDFKFQQRCLKCMQKNCAHHCSDWYTLNDFDKFKEELQKRLSKCERNFKTLHEKLYFMSTQAKVWSNQCEMSLQNLRSSHAELFSWDNYEQLSFELQLKMQSQTKMIDITTLKIVQELDQFIQFINDKCLLHGKHNFPAKINPKIQIVQKNKDAKTLFREAVQLNNNNFIDQALIKITESIKKCPDDYFLHYCKGNIHYNQCQFQEALSQYEKSLQLKHTRICLIAKVETMLQLSQYKEIIQNSILYDQEYKIGSELRMFKGVALFWLRKFEEAEQLFIELKQQYPQISTQWEGFIEYSKKEQLKKKINIDQILNNTDENIASHMSRRSQEDDKLCIYKLNLDTRYLCHFVTNFENVNHQQAHE